MKITKYVLAILTVIILISIISVADDMPIGTKIGTFMKTDRDIYVNGKRVQGYLIENELAICIEDLEYCGFDGVWNNDLRRSSFKYNSDKKIYNTDKIVEPKITGNSIVKTDVEIILDEDRVKAYATDGYCLVKLSDLSDFSDITKGKVFNIKIDNNTLNKPSIVKFKDELLEDILRKKLNKPYGRLDKEMLLYVESLKEGEISKAKNELIDDLLPPVKEEKLSIENTYGIEYLTNLKELELLSTIKSEDKNRVKNLSNLKSLKLRLPLVYDIEFLKELGLLEELDIDRTESVKVLGELNNLKKLTLVTKAYDLSPLSKLNNLTDLTLTIYDLKKTKFLEFLKDMDNLKKLKLNINIKDSIDLKERRYYDDYGYIKTEDFINNDCFKELNNLDELELTLNISSSDTIKDLSFLKNYTSVTNLNIAMKKEQSLEGIEHLKNLKKLKIYNKNGNTPRDIRLLESLTSLEILDLDYQNITDLEPIRNMKNLKELYISNNPSKISSFEPLEKLTNIKTLKVSTLGQKEANESRELSFLENLNKLENLEISGYRINDISWIKKMYNLKIINLSKNNITDISPLKKLINIKDMNLSDNKIKNIDVLKNKEKLRELDISSNNISKLPNEFYLPNLEVLKCSQNEIQNISFDRKMLKLNSLDMSVNKLKQVRNLENVPNLVQLSLLGNEISDLSFLRNMINLKELDISYNNITNIYPLSKLIYLEKLGIGVNQINTISPIYNLKKLKVLNIDEKNKSEILTEKDTVYPKNKIWNRLKKLDKFYVNYGRIYNDSNTGYKNNTKTTYEGKILFENNIMVPKEGLKLTVSTVSYGHWGVYVEEVKEIVIPYGEKEIGYSFDIPNNTLNDSYPVSNPFKINIKLQNDRYEIETNSDFKIYSIKDDQTISNCDIKILERTKISGKILLDDEILNMDLDNKGYATREIAIYPRINDEKREVIVTADLKQKEVSYEFYLPKKLAGKEFTLEYAIKDYGYINFRYHLGMVGNVLKREFLTEENQLSPNIDKAKRIIFNGKDMEVDDVFIDM